MYLLKNSVASLLYKKTLRLVLSRMANFKHVLCNKTKIMNRKMLCPYDLLK